MAATAHYTKVTVEVLDMTRVPLNASTHVPVIWSFSLQEFETEKIEEEERVISKKLPRPDWRFGIDIELWEKLEKSYVETAMEMTKDMETSWRIKTIEYVMARASAKSRMVQMDREEDRKLSRKWFAGQIKDLSMKIQNRRFNLAGEFAKHVLTEDLVDIFSEKGLEVKRMEGELLILKQQMNMELHRALQEEAELDSDQLMVTMRSGDSSKFHKTAKVSKVIINETRRYNLYRK